MLNISETDIAARIARDNPWWTSESNCEPEEAYVERVYLESFCDIALNFKVQRAAVLLGPRRIGKTVMVRQLIQRAIKQGVDPARILYASIDTPVYAGIALEKFLEFIETKEPALVCFDEIQYLKNWETHLKDLVDTYPKTKFVATGSAAAALKLASNESGAGRFSEFILPPLTFHEYIVFIGRDTELIAPLKHESRFYESHNIDALNLEFVNYLNFGGYPEAVLNEHIREKADQFVRNDIVDKVLLKDLPNLYGIQDIQELNKLFSVLAYNSGQEVNLEGIAQRSGLTKPTIKKYIEYLESAFLVVKVSTVGDNCRSFKRERNFKIYLNNPSMRAALFAPVTINQPEKIGHLAESAIFSQWQHSSTFKNLRYARWRNEGEVDIVYLRDENQKPLWIGEVKWSDRIEKDFGGQTKNLKKLLKMHPSIDSALLTTRTFSSNIQLAGRELEILPSALYCYTAGKNITSDT